MERGYDKLTNPVGQAAIIGLLFLITAVCIAGAFYWKRSMKRDSDLRKEWREQLESEKTDAS